jgi:hypothetical protein
MPRKLILAAILAAALIGVYVYLRHSGQTPAGQAPLQALNLPDLRTAFNNVGGNVRVLLLLSPT